jgi:hypothetical protein
VGLLVLLENLHPTDSVRRDSASGRLPLTSGAMQPILVWIATNAGSIVGALGRRLGYNRLRRLAGNAGC